MGLLDDLLGGLAGPAAGRGQQPSARGGPGGGMGGVLAALLPVVLAMLADRGVSRSGGGSGGGPGGAPGGGLGDVLGQVLGGGRGSAGGLGGLLDQLRQAGFGEQADSWVSRGQNKSIPPEAMPQIFGREGIEEISRRAGVTEDEATRGLSELLPEVVDRVTPDGEVPDFDALTNSVDDLARRFGRAGG
jgi:uncharacterized protein YidB (DUF937 family)